MNDEPLDERLDGRWKRDAQQTAISTIMERFLTPEGKEFFTIAVRKSDQNNVKMILTAMHELTAAHENHGGKLSVYDMATAWITIIQATLASATYQNERKSWEN